MIAEAVVVTAAVLAGNTLLRPLVNAINRAPVDEQAAEATYRVRVQTMAEHVGEAREQLLETLDGASYPVRDVDVVGRSDELREVVATLVSTAVDAAELDAVVAQLSRSLLISHAGWTSSSED